MHTFLLPLLFQSFNLHIVCMCRTYIRKISPRSLNIMMVTGYSGFMKTMQLFGRKKSHGSTEIDIAFLIHGFIGMNRLIKFFSGQSLSCSDNGKRSTPSSSFILHASRIFSSGRNHRSHRKYGGVLTEHNICSPPDTCRCGH